MPEVFSINDTASETQKNGDSVKQRKRGTQETRRQLIARLENPEISLQEASILLGVCRATVRRYCDEGLLRHTRTEGSQRRFHYLDIKDFIRKQPHKTKR